MRREVREMKIERERGGRGERKKERVETEQEENGRGFKGITGNA